jgi:hypothetical protein
MKISSIALLEYVLTPASGLIYWRIDDEVKIKDCIDTLNVI